MSFTFFAPGHPRPQGSKRNLGRGVMLESSKHVQDWRSQVALFAQQAAREAGLAPLADGVSLELTFFFPRPLKHYHSVKGVLQLKHGAPAACTTRPDLDKLVRAVLDACTGIVWRDDCLVHGIFADKRYDVRPGVRVTVRRDGRGQAAEG